MRIIKGLVALYFGWVMFIAGAQEVSQTLVMDCSLRLRALPGESQTTRSGGGLLSRSGLSLGGNTTKTTSRQLKWEATVSFWNPKQRPDSCELRVYHIGRRGNDQQKVILASETKSLSLDGQGRAVETFLSPQVRFTRTRSSALGGRSSSSRSSSGERIDGCIAQVVVDGKLVRAWSSNSTWSEIARDFPFSAASLTRPRRGLR